MPTTLPPLRLTGATVLRDRQMQQRTVALADGRIAAGPFPAIDLSGYLILPGIIDLSSTALRHHRAFAPMDQSLPCLEAELAAAGVTTALIQDHWGWQDPTATPTSTADLIQAMKARKGCNLRLQLVLDASALPQSDAVLGLRESGRLGTVLFRNRLSHDLALADTNPEEFAARARTAGHDPATLLATLRDAHDRRGEHPRRLCRLAEAFDASSTIYGSHQDPDGESREMFSLLGAKLCHTPAAYSAAAVAHAVGDPICAPARGILGPPDGDVSARTLVRAGKIDALSGGPAPADLARAAFALVDQNLCDLSQAWSLISSGPAQILRLPDRGEISPGKRADLTIINARTREVEATISKGRLSHLRGDAAGRFLALAGAVDIAAE